VLVAGSSALLKTRDFNPQYIGFFRWYLWLSSKYVRRARTQEQDEARKKEREREWERQKSARESEREGGEGPVCPSVERHRVDVTGVFCVMRSMRMGTLVEFFCLVWVSAHSWPFVRGNGRTWLALSAWRISTHLCGYDYFNCSGEFRWRHPWATCERHRVNVTERSHRDAFRLISVILTSSPVLVSSVRGTGWTWLASSVWCVVWVWAH